MKRLRLLAAASSDAKLPPPRRQLVDLRPLQTAHRMATLAGTPEEQVFAHEAEKVGDHEVDLAFYDALRRVQETPPKLSPEAKEIAARKDKAEKAVNDDQDNIKESDPQGGSGTGLAERQF